MLKTKILFMATIFATIVFFIVGCESKSKIVSFDTKSITFSVDEKIIMTAYNNHTNCLVSILGDKDIVDFLQYKINEKELFFTESEYDFLNVKFLFHIRDIDSLIYNYHKNLNFLQKGLKSENQLYYLADESQLYDIISNEKPSLELLKVIDDFKILIEKFNSNVITQNELRQSLESFSEKKFKSEIDAVIVSNFIGIALSSCDLLDLYDSFFNPTDMILFGQAVVFDAIGAIIGGVGGILVPPIGPGSGAQGGGIMLSAINILAQKLAAAIIK